MTYLYAIVVMSIVGGLLSALLLIANRFLANYGPCEIKVNEEEPFTIEGGCTLLEALYEQRIFIPSACGGQGTCGFCKVQILDGGGPVLPTELPFLTRHEIDEHTRLACQVKVKEPLRVHVREDYLNVQEFKAVVTAARMLTHDTREIRLRLVEPEEIDFKPGQYVQVQVPGQSPPVYRAYSVSSPPHEKNDIELVVRLIPGGLGSTYLHNVQVDDEVTFTGPYGEFILDEGADTEIICVGGGCGMAPMKSIIHYLYNRSPDRKCTLYFGARTTADLLYYEEFSELAKDLPNFRVHFALSEPGEQDADWGGETGFIHLSVAKHCPEAGPRQAFLCGPEPMIDATMKVLQDKELAEDQVFYDKF